MNVLYRLTATETKLFFREPTAVFFVLAFPSLLLVILGFVPPFREPNPDIGGLRVIDLYAPIVITMAVGLLSLNMLPQLFAAYREKGILRRMATTPVRPSALLGAQLAMAVTLSVGSALLILAVARLGFDVALPDNLAVYLLMYVLCLLAMLTLGLLIGSLAPTAKGAAAIGSILFFPVVFFAGLWLPREQMPEVLRRISDFTPLGAGVQSLQDATAGHWPQLLHVAVMLGWTIVAGALAARYFRWE
ncbi:ABC transporter permease [Actinophytocola gossypii]|uniref:Transport permease protein n=1 Tax=Actinophytocola gossypii TaxID=2812003 RepID=A0ABT2JHA4_9PSEU|nr:ABC transporter permease [Actinophytocola gossypii]MCT2587118.1 ABC transporter permease [Actinophytocola gossypii]